MKKSVKTKEAKNQPISNAIMALTLLALLFQGGFTNAIWGIAGIAIVAILAIKPIEIPPKRLLITMLLLPIGYLVSIFTTGMQVEGWMGILKIAVAFLFILAPHKPKPEHLCLYAGMLVAGVGLLGFSGWLPLPGMAVAGRLLSVFQYANATAIFLAACAIITRLSDKPEWAVIMEIALILTQSIGGLGVYVIGWAFYALAKKEKISRHLCGFILSGIIAAAILALTRLTPANWLAPVICIAYIIFRKQVSGFLQKAAGAKWFAACAAATMALFAVGVFILRGIRPLLTYIERIIQITDGMNIMLRYPLGFGPGNWALHHMEYQSANYTVSHIHSSFVQIGVDGGIIALLGFAALIFLWIYRQRINKYSVAAMMILFHATQDFTLSFLSIVMLLIVLMRASMSEKEFVVIGTKTKARVLKILLSAILACYFLLFFIRETEKNQARWQAEGNDVANALHRLENRLILPDDMESKILRLSYSSQVDDFDAFNRALGDIRRHNANSTFLVSQHYFRQGKYDSAIEWMLYSIEKSPHQRFGYEQIEIMLVNIPPIRQVEIIEKVRTIRENATQNAHMLSGFIE